MHLSHLRFGGPDAQKQSPRDWKPAIELIKHGWLRIERHVAANAEQNFLRGPDVAHAAKRKSPDAESWVFFFNPQTRAIGGTQEIVLVDEFKARVEIILI